MNTIASKPSGARGIIIVLLLAVVAAGAYMFLTAPDRRTTSERVGDAAENATKGNLGDAARSLGDQTPAERAGSAIKKAGDDVTNAGN